MASTKVLATTAATAIAGIMLVAFAPLAASPVGASSRARQSSERFCTPARVIADQVAKPVLEVQPQQAAVLALTLKRTAKNAPKKVSRAMRDLATEYTAVRTASDDANRTKAAFAGARKFEAGQKVFAAYYSTHCVATPVSSPDLPGVGAANQAACLADSRALQIAETEYSTLNNGFATMDQLLSAGLLSSRSAMHPDITVGSPPGGYTLVGNRVCNDVPVGG